MSPNQTDKTGSPSAASARIFRLRRGGLNSPERFQTSTSLPQAVRHYGGGLHLASRGAFLAAATGTPLAIFAFQPLQTLA